MSSRTCPDWPMLMEVAPDLQFKHYTLREAQLPADAVATFQGVDFDAVTICCDLDSHVFNPDHTQPSVATALSSSHWFGLREWVSHARGTDAG